jgi:small subunit ribosomal protein S15
MFIHKYLLANIGCGKTQRTFRSKAMALNAKQKARVTKEVKRHEKDTGSPEYQIALFSERIKKLTAHLKKNAKDFHSRRGLLKMVSKRKRLLDYLKKTDEKSYKTLIKKLGLKG